MQVGCETDSSSAFDRAGGERANGETYLKLLERERYDMIGRRFQVAQASLVHTLIGIGRHEHGAF